MTNDEIMLSARSTSDDFLAVCARITKANPTTRPGVLCTEVLHVMRPALAKQLVYAVNRDVDPFNDDMKIPRLFAWAKLRWDE
jgi:hypothetical protein